MAIQRRMWLRCRFSDHFLRSKNWEEKRKNTSTSMSKRHRFDVGVGVLVLIPPRPRGGAAARGPWTCPWSWGRGRAASCWAARCGGRYSPGRCHTAAWSRACRPRPTPSSPHLSTAAVVEKPDLFVDTATRQEPSVSQFILFIQRGLVGAFTGLQFNS